MTPWYRECIHKTDEENQTEEEKKELKKEEDLEFERVQEEASLKQKKRNEVMGELLRSKGFIWLATANDMMGGWQQAGNVLRTMMENPWMCLMPDVWKGTPSEELVLKDIQDENGKPFEYEDRRQEIVFIGHRLNRDAIEKLLDECLLNDEEMAMGPEKWKETMEESDNSKYFLESDIIEEDEDDEDGEEDEEDMEDESDAEK